MTPEERRGITIQQNGKTTTIARVTCPTAPKFWRWRDFPFATLTMAAVPFWLLTWFDRSKSGVRPLAETLFAALFVMAASYVMLSEGLHNWQSVWTCAAYFLLARVLCNVRYIDVAKPVPTFQSSSTKQPRVAAQRQALPADA